jgi:hypothetical protein
MLKKMFPFLFSWLNMQLFRVHLRKLCALAIQSGVVQPPMQRRNREGPGTGEQKLEDVSEEDDVKKFYVVPVVPCRCLLMF